MAHVSINYASNGFLAVESGEEHTDTQASPISNPVTPRILMEFSVSADVAPWIMAPETRDAWWSPHFFRMLGYEDGGFEHNSYTFRKLIHPDQLEMAIQSMDALIAGETDRYHAVFRLRHEDGSWRWHEATARMARLSDGLNIVCGGLKDVHTWRESELERNRLFEQNKMVRAEAEAAQAAARQSEPSLRTSVASGEQTALSACAATGEAWLLDD